MKPELDTELRAFRDDAFRQGIGIYGRIRDEDGKMLAALVPSESHPKIGLYDKWPPLVRLSDEEAQLLMDSLWKCGVRPSERGHADVTSIQRHLEDMRTIAFFKLGIHEARAKR